MHLKKQGAYLSRTLSFDGCTFSVQENGSDDEMSQRYSASAELWSKVKINDDNEQLEVKPKQH